MLLLLAKIQRDDPKDCPLYFAPNLLLLVLNIYEICKLLERQFPFLSAITEKIVDHIVQVGSYFVSEMQDEARLRYIVFEKDFDNRDSLELISSYNITSIMDSK